MSESDCQKQVVQWYKLQYPDKLIIAIPNGSWLSGDARRRAILMNKMKREGLVVGASDLFIASPSGPWHGLFLELKDIDKTWCHVTEAQRLFMAKVKEQGYAALWAAGFEEARDIIEEYFGLE